MAENHDSEEYREGSAAAEVGDSNHSIPVEYTSDSAGNDQMDGSQPMQDALNDGKVTEDGGREDMFVDCSEEIEISETQTNSEEKDNVRDDRTEELHGTTQVEDLLAEIADLRHKLEKTVSEKQSFAQKYEEERENLKGELGYLHYQLKSLNDQNPFLEKVSVAHPDHHDRPGLGDRDEMSLASDASLHQIVTECSEFLNSAMGLYSQTENSIKELHASLQMKDSEIEDLNSKITEFTISREVTVLYLNSVQEAGCRTSEAQVEREHMIQEIANRILASLPVSVSQVGGFLDDFAGEKFSHIEKSISLLIEKHNQFLSGIDRLKLCLSDTTPDTHMEDEVGVFMSACVKLHELKMKEVDLEEKVIHFQNENAKLVEQLDKDKAVIESANAEIGKLNVEIEQEKTRYANTKEKLSLAVTKGKALVQQRDSLKQALADKTSELEKCLIELQEKSNALGFAEQSKDLLIKSESMAIHLQESLAQKDSVLQKCGEILSHAAGADDIQSFDLVEKLRWIVDERNALKGVTIEFQNVSDALSSINFPENLLANDMETRLKWLVESFSTAKEEAMKLQEEIAEIRVASSKEVDRLVQSVLAETQEKSYLQEELEDLRSKYDGVFKKEHQVACERDQMVSMLLEASGMTNSLEKVNISQRDIAKMIAKIKEEGEASVESSYSQVKILERLQSLLYVRTQEVMLYEHLLEEEMLNSAQMKQVSEKLRVVTQELHALKDEKVSLEKELIRAEEKAALIREKLSMAVKKGKGLVQERENLRRLLDEKNTEVERLTSELQDQISACSDCRDQINKLEADMDCIPKLETDLVATKEQRNQLEQFLVESNNMLQKVIESIDSIDHPSNLVFKEPVEKVQWLSGYLNECQNSQEELEKLKEETITLISKLVEAETSMKSLKDALLDAQNSISQVLEEKRELEVAKIQSEEELQKSLMEVASQKSKFAEVSATIRSFEDALTVAEDNISNLAKEKEDALVSRAAIEMELQKLKEENSIQASRLTDAEVTIQSLEDALSEAQKNLSVLAEENNKTQIGRSDLEEDMKKLKAEADSQANKLADAAMTIKSLDDARLGAENKISDLVKENKNAEHEISALNSKLQACLQELEGSHGGIANSSREISGYLTSIQMILRDDSLLSLLKKSFEDKIESLGDMNNILKEMRDCFFDMIGPDMLQSCPVMEDDYSVSTLSPDGLDNALEMEMVNVQLNAVDDENVTLNFEKTLEGLRLRDKNLAEKIGSCSGILDDFILALLKRLQVAKDGVIVARELVRSLKQRANDVEMDRQAQENTVAMLESDMEILLSACTKATEELELEVENNLSELSSVSILENSSTELEAFGQDALIDHDLKSEGNKYVHIAEKLLLATRHCRNFNKHFHGMKHMMVSTVEDLRNQLIETKTTCGSLLEERDLNQKKISKLETDLEVAENLCREMKLKIEDHEARQPMLKERETELLVAHSTSPKNVHEAQEFSLSASQIKSLFNKISAIGISLPESEVEDLETTYSTDVQKLFYIIDNFNGLKDKINSEAQEKENLQSMLEKQVTAVEHLNEEVKGYVREKQESERMRNELALGLESIIQKLGGDKLVGGEKIAHVTGLLSALDMMVMATKAESENLKSKTDELSTKLLSTEKFVDELSSKVKLLEGSSHGGVAFPETIKEKGISELSSSNSQPEISEIQELGQGKNVAVSSVPSAAHVRTLRKGSGDHLAISIDPESERLANNEQADEDKGHVFKSLNTSGLIPRQGKMIGDRIDGIWVSGGRALMSHPRARLGLIAYWLLLHIWLLGSIL
ncbi:trans-Golgi network-localized SYP41-interacting protein 1-like [Coffea arabica]|uniref:Trans-Golgi network-localized SYP41-interacting protein 1-like n=1 Tax=Coffea arabica TaxID=13443 RepID=A0A6P6VDA0_COFAR|nr:myosin-9-like [Coffea arabica]XP_027099948.1 myosin-9-like [Coffea arabica]